MKNNVKLAIREDEGAGVIRAFVSRMDDSERFEIATLSLAVARLHPSVFDFWKQAVSAALKEMVERTTGATVTGMEEFRPKDKN